MSKKIVFLDIESSPIQGLTWTMYEANVLHVIEPVKIIAVAWKELGDKEVHCKALSDYDGYCADVLNDEQLIREIWKVLDEAAIVCGHNLDAFDIKRLNARFVYHGLTAPSPYKTIDTLKIAKKFFQFDNNTLDQLGAYLGEGRKEATGGFGLWLKCMAGDLKAWEKMKKYNAQDVLLLERIYLRLRPYITNHPDTNGEDKGINEDHHCPTCAGSNVEKRGFTMTLTGRRQRYQCRDCGSWSSGTFKRDYASTKSMS